MSAKPVHEFVVPLAAVGQRLDIFLSQQGLPFSRSQLTRRIDEGEVLLDGGRAKPGQKLKPAQRIRFRPPPPRPVRDQPEAIPLTVLFEDRHLIVIDKPAGLVVHPAPGHQHGTLVNALLHHCGELPVPPRRPSPADDDLSDDDDGDRALAAAGAAELSIGGERRPGIVHRLDQGTSGVLVCAKDEPTLVGLQSQFQVHSIERRYLAIVEGVVAERGSFDSRYGRHPRDRKRFTARSGGKRAVTHYAVCERLRGATLVEVKLETGRTHQIRVHFSEAGHPLLGDGLYGRAARLPLVREVGQRLQRQALHARWLGFRHPITDAWLEFSSSPPADFRAALDRLRSPDQAALPAGPEQP
jgi:23S rRNA pseudouridine1911/1915/1917 synthase